MEESDNFEENSLTGWNKEEKFQLLEALKEIGSQDVIQICTYIPTKNAEEVVTALNYYKSLCKTNSRKARQVQSKPNQATEPTIPLASWAKHISDNHSFEEMQTETATALRLIADFEDRPTAVCTEGINFKKIYHTLADALEGKDLPEDKLSKKIIDKCAVETALTSKTFVRNNTFKQIFSLASGIDTEFEFMPKIPNNKELTNIRHLARQKSYNPLNIPENYLKASQKIGN